MAGNSAILTVKILSDASKATAGVDQAASRFGKFEQTAKRAAIPAAAVGVALVAGAKKAIDAASRTQQAMGGVDAVFGRYAAGMKRAASAAADSIGLAKSEYGELATVIGSQLKNAGIPMDKVAGQTKTLIALGGDLSAMYGGTTKEAVEALSSALKGETDPIEKYGASISAAKVSAELAARGQDKLTGKAAAQAKAMATLSLITKQTADAHGAAAREYDTAASAQARMSAKTENMAASLGAILLPVVAVVADKLAALAEWATRNTTAVQILIGVIAGLAGAVLAVNAAFKVYAAAQKVVTAAQWAFNAAVSANPIALVVIAVLALVAAFVILYKKSARFRALVDAMWAGIQNGARAAGRVVSAIWRAVWSAISGAARAFGAAVRVVLGSVTRVARSVAGIVRAVWRAAWTAVTGYVRAYVAAFRAIMAGIRAVVSNVVGWVRSAWRNMWQAIENAARTAANAITAPFRAIKSVIDSVIRAVGSLIAALGRIKVPKISLPRIPGMGRSVQVAAPAAPGFRASTMTTTGAARASTTSGPTFNITGALDPEATARLIRRILDGHDRRVGLRTA